MSVIQNKAVAQRVVDEGINGRNLEALDSLVAPGFTNHDSANPQVTDLAGFKAWQQTLWAGFPDCSVQLTDVIAEDDRVVHVWVMRGTQTGEFAGMPPSGKTIDFAGLTVNRFVDGKIVDSLWGYNMLVVLQQLGLVPASPPA